MKFSSELRAALGVALLMIAFQVASKAVRDAFYLAAFPASALPAIVIGSAVLSIALVPAYARGLARWGPSRLLPAVFGTSGLSLLGLWALSPISPGPVAVVLYLHVAVLGPMIVSSFWGLVSETFDARAAKRQIGWIGACGTAGGVLGGLLAFSFGGSAGTFALPALAALHLACAAIVPIVAGARPATAAAADTGFHLMAGARRLAHDAYLGRLAMLVATTAACAALLDYAFKAALAGSTGERADLLRGFSIYYGGVALVTFLAQVALSRPALTRLGPAGAAALLPATAVVAGIGALFAPGASGVAIARGAENVARNSMFRSGYELLFAPLAESERRANKPLIDVAAERAGDMLGALVVAALLGAGVVGRAPILVAAVVFGLTALSIASWFRTGYLRRIEARLRAHDTEDPRGTDELKGSTSSLDWSQSIDLSTMSSGLDLSSLRSALERPETAGGSKDIQPLDDLDEAVRSGSTTRFRRALERHKPLDAAALRTLLPLLGRERLAGIVVTALHHPPVGLSSVLVEFMLDPSHEMAARRRVPRLLSRYDTAEAGEGLLRGLSDPRFEMRSQCGRALLRLRERLDRRPGGAALDHDRVLAAVLREVDVGRPVWEAQQASGHEDWGEETPLVEHVIRERANASLAHVFTLLALVLPRQPLEQAVRGLHGDDPMRRGLALEYLESVLPPDIRDRLWPFLEAESAARRAPPSERSMADIIAANESIVIDLDELRKMEAMGRAALEEARKAAEPEPPPAAPPEK